MNKAIGSILLGNVLSLLTGCVPIYQRYQRVEVADASYLYGTCRSYGPRDWAYIPLNGIFVSLSLTTPEFGVHYPKETTVILDSDEITVTGSRNGLPVTWRATLVPNRHGGFQSDPVEFDYMIDPITLRSTRPTQGKPEIVWASYRMVDPGSPNHIVQVPQDLEQAVVSVPAMTINNTKFKATDLSIVHRKFVGVIPVNC